jgi:hypothetical protein
MYRDAIKSHYTKDMKLAYEITEKRDELLKQCDECYERYWKVKYASQVIERFMISGSQRITKTVIN